MTMLETSSGAVVVDVHLLSAGGHDGGEKMTKTTTKKRAIPTTTAPTKGTDPFTSEVTMNRDTILAPEAVAMRTASFTASASHMRDYDYHSWVATTFIFRARAPSNFIYPWLLVMSVTVSWTLLTRTFFTALQHPRYGLSEFERVYALIFTALGFLLVFRLTRAAVRYWDCRTAWGAISMRGG